jgi:hypothetical protein
MFHRIKALLALERACPVYILHAESSNPSGFTYLTSTLHSVKLPVKLPQRSQKSGYSFYGYSVKEEAQELDFGKKKSLTSQSWCPVLMFP